MAAARKPTRKPGTAKRLARNKAATPRPAAAPTPPVETRILPALPPEPPGCPVVGIGASAGGLEALEAFFHHIPPNSGMAFLVISHQHPGHLSLLPSLLSKCTAMPVVEAADGMKVESDRVYLAPGGTNLAVLHGCFI